MTYFNRTFFFWNTVDKLLIQISFLNGLSNRILKNRKKKEGGNNKQIFLESRKKGELFFSFFCEHNQISCLHYFLFHHCIGNFLNTSLFIFEKFWIRLIFFTHLTFKSTASFFVQSQNLERYLKR